MENKKKFYEFLEEYATFMEHVLECENEKLAALLSGELIRIEHSISQQQATAKQLENLEKNRTILQNKAGFGDLSFMQIIGGAPEEYKAELSGLYSRIENSISNIKFLNNKSMGIAKDSLHMVDHAAKTSKPSGAQSYGYSKNRQEDAPPPSVLLEKKV